jgi:curved DNA-binding protein CbpA
MPRKLFDPYAVLGVPPTATSDEITRAYRSKVRALHPDTRAARRSSPLADEQLQRVVAAYALLRDPEPRARYDRATTRDDRPAERSPTAPRAPAETTNLADALGVVAYGSSLPGGRQLVSVRWVGRTTAAGWLSDGRRTAAGWLTVGRTTPAGWLTARFHTKWLRRVK